MQDGLRCAQTYEKIAKKSEKWSQDPPKGSVLKRSAVSANPCLLLIEAGKMKGQSISGPRIPRPSQRERT